MSSEPTPVADRRGCYLALFAVGEFRAVFAAHLLSTLGTVVSEIALSVLVYDLTRSPLLSALTFALGLLPHAFGGTLLSSLADRLPARTVLVGCDLICAACAAVMVAPGTPVGGLLALRCCIAAVAPVFTGTRSATLADILGEGPPFVLGRSVLRLVNQGGQLVGFGAGGLLLVAVSPRAALGGTAATFCFSALLLGLGTRWRPTRGSVGAAPPVAGWSSGTRRLFLDRRVRALFLLAWTPPTFVVVSESLLTPYAHDLGVGSAGLGLLLCGMPVGAVVSESLAGSLLGPRGRARLTRPVAVLCLLPSIGYAAHPTLPLALACQVLTGCGISYSMGLDAWMVAAVPQELLGRAMTLLSAGLMTAQGLGMAAAGAAAELWPVHGVVAAGGGLGVLAVCGALLALRRAGPLPTEPSRPARPRTARPAPR